MARLTTVRPAGARAVAGSAQPAAPHALRAAAGVLDFGLVMVLAGTTSEPFPLAIPIALFVAYHTLAVWLTGQTIGKAVFGLRVVRPTRPRTLRWSLGRSTIGYFGCTLLGLGLLVAARDSRHRALHDLVFGSQVVETGGGRLNLRTAAVRLADFARMREEEAEKRRTAAGVAVLTLLFGWLQSVANIVVGIVDRLSDLFGGSASGGSQSPLAQLGTTAKAGLGVVATGASMAVVASVPPVADATKWLFEPRHYFSAAADSPAQGFATPEDAIAAFARARRWQEQRGWNYEGSCERLRGAPRKLVCSAPWTGPSSNLQLAQGEQIYVIAPGWSDVHDGFVALKRSGGGWVVTRELTG